MFRNWSATKGELGTSLQKIRSVSKILTNGYWVLLLCSCCLEQYMNYLSALEEGGKSNQRVSRRFLVIHSTSVIRRIWSGSPSGAKKNLHIHLKCWSRRILGNLIFWYGQKWYREIMPRNLEKWSRVCHSWSGTILSIRENKFQMTRVRSFFRYALFFIRRDSWLQLAAF